MLKMALVTLLLLFGVGSVIAQERTEVSKTLLRAWTGKEPDALWRRNMAQAIMGHCNELSQRLPRNSPREADWLSQELNSTDAERMFRVLQTVEYSRWLMSHYVMDCLNLTRELVRNDLSRNSEAILWVKFVRSVNDTQGLVSNGTRLGLMKDANIDPYGLSWWSAIRLAIIERAVLPLLEGPAPQ